MEALAQHSRLRLPATAAHQQHWLRGSAALCPGGQTSRRPLHFGHRAESLKISLHSLCIHHAGTARPAQCTAQRRQRVAAQATQEAAFPSSQAVDYGALSEELEELAKTVAEGLRGTSLYLVGMMGSGKSHVGKLLARLLNYRFLDTDAVIEAAAKATIAEIFAEDGEEAFREAETQTLAGLAAYPRCVVSTGGGAVLRNENWAQMQQGVVVWLSGPPELLAARAVKDGTASRPLLTDASTQSPTAEQGGDYEATLQKMRALLEQRRGRYAAADITVSVEGTEPHTSAPAALVALRVLKEVKRRVQETQDERERMRPK